MSPANQPREKKRPPRKKACNSCTRSKVRCDLERPTCARCKSLGRACEYATPSLVSHAPEIQSNLTSSIGVSPGIPYTLSDNAPDTPGQTYQRDTIEHGNNNGLDFTNTNLAPSFSAEHIRDRWLRPYILPPLGRDEIPKLYHPFTLQYISRILSTYPHRMLRDGDVPPIIHHTQVSKRSMPLALANCYTLVRMWIQAAPGSEAIVVNTLEREMDRLAEERPDQPDIKHLSSFQAYLIYSILLYFSPPTTQSLVTDKTMIILMELAFRTARHGLLSAPELSRSKPSWESWIVASTKRRAIYAMYLFSSVYNAEHALPNFIADELKGVFLPEGKALWEARDRDSWGREYDRHLRKWGGDGMLEISELWKSEETGSISRRERIERWLKTVDEFGMMLFAVCSHIHGC
ncbi:hypothetical protein BDW59DRAFT_180990 [Aspergillus cavernicola]|uniref:Zn(2)-C6 fungal-type domain-containing protein n=1 Tax=Aspergillus cavernicola TaxID=176166 RepID=A0ABR4IXN6_9EURO